MLALQLLVDGIINGCVLGTISISFTLIYSTTRMFHVAHAGVFTLGAYFVWTFVQAGVPGPVAVVLGVACCMAVGAAIQRYFYQPLAARNATPLVVMIASLGLLAIIENGIAAVYSQNVLTFSEWWGKAVVPVGGLPITGAQILSVVMGLGAYAFLRVLSQRTLLGRKIRAVASNPFLAEIAQVKPKLVYIWVYAIGSMIVCLPSALIAAEFGLRPYNGLLYLINASIAMIASGLGSITGAFVVSILLAVLQNLSLLIVPSQWSIGVTFILFILLMLFRPRGLFAPAR
ncbi:MAG TPA: branched-chain amino acid ABC transporter permease [Magnetospirillaceae bacterium]|jgi:branched-chain amino acid transport system permease protein